jgi:cell division septum initiation protein DivIVA
VDVHEKLDEVTAVVESARAMPMSASCIVNRAEVLTLLEELRALLPEEIDLAEQLLAGRDRVLADGRAEADRIVAAAQDERMRLVSETEVFAQAQLEAERLVAEAADDSESMRRQVDEYVDGKLATFEITLGKTMAAVQRGRDKLRGRGEMEALGTLGTETGEIPVVREG